jgi:hypothetical protein
MSVQLSILNRGKVVYRKMTPAELTSQNVDMLKRAGAEVTIRYTDPYRSRFSVLGETAHGKISRTDEYDGKLDYIYLDGRSGISRRNIIEVEVNTALNDEGRIDPKLQAEGERLLEAEARSEKLSQKLSVKGFTASAVLDRLPALIGAFPSRSKMLEIALVYALVSKPEVRKIIESWRQNGLPVEMGLYGTDYAATLHSKVEKGGIEALKQFGKIKITGSDVILGIEKGKDEVEDIALGRDWYRDVREKLLLI